MKQQIPTVGIALAKKIFHLVGMDTTGTMVWRKRLPRHALVPFLAPLPPVTLGMEAWGGAHDGARPLCQQGHTVTRRAPQGVQPSGKANHNDMRDAEAIAAAVTRPTMRFVPLKDIAQQDVQALPLTTGSRCSAGAGSPSVPRRRRASAALRLPASGGPGAGSPGRAAATGPRRSASPGGGEERRGPPR
jgi:hypothetical protein